MKTFAVQEKLLSTLLTYLAGQPYNHVAQLIAQLQQSSLIEVKSEAAKDDTKPKKAKDGQN